MFNHTGLVGLLLSLLVDTHVQTHACTHNTPFRERLVVRECDEQYRSVNLMCDFEGAIQILHHGERARREHLAPRGLSHGKSLHMLSSSKLVSVHQNGCLMHRRLCESGLILYHSVI